VHQIPLALFCLNTLSAAGRITVATLLVMLKKQAKQNDSAANPMATRREPGTGPD